MDIKLEGELESRFKKIMDSEGIQDPNELMDNMMFMVESLIDGRLNTIGKEEYKEYQRIIRR